MLVITFKRLFPQSRATSFLCLLCKLRRDRLLNFGDTVDEMTQIPHWRVLKIETGS